MSSWGTLLYSSCICVSSTDSKWMSVIITFLLFLTLVGIPLAIAIIYKRKKKGLIIALFLYGSNLFCDYIDVSIYRGANCIPAPAAICTITFDQWFIPKKESQLTGCSAVAVKNKVKKIVVWHLLCVFPIFVQSFTPWYPLLHTMIPSIAEGDNL